jgi:hypothetical protein
LHRKNSFTPPCVAEVIAATRYVDEQAFMKTIAEFQKLAEDCRALAAKLTDPQDKRAVELMAAAWNKVANEREAALKAKPPLEPA